MRTVRHQGSYCSGTMAQPGAVQWAPGRLRTTAMETSSSAMAERPRELDQRFQTGSQFEVIID